MEKSVIISCMPSCGSEDQQQCLIPVECLKRIKGNIGCYVKIKLSEGKLVICRTVPVIGSYCSESFQVIVCNCVSSGCSKDEICSKTNFKIQLSDILILKPHVLESISTVVIFKSVQDVLRYRQKKKQYERTVCRLLKQYRFTNKCVIHCSNNPLANLIGVLEICIENCGLNEYDIGVIDHNTNIVISNVESEDRIKLTSQKIVNLGGLDDILCYLRQLICEPWKKQKEFAEAGIRFPSGVLLVGPPGCGKTSLVQQICAETGTCLIGTSAADLLSPYEGETEGNLLKVAERAQTLSEEGPCVFFIDEIDSLCPIRTKESSLFNLKLASQVLLLIDNCKICSNLVLMAATNRPYDVDPAARRSGRLEVEILLNVPSGSERESILKTQCSDILPKHNPDLAAIAHATPGFVGADLKALCEATAVKIEEREETESDTVTEMMLMCANAITPSINKNLEFITSKPKVSSVGGLDKIKKQLEEIFIHHTYYAQEYDKLKLKRPKGVLLYGPRGCGKTRLVASLASARGCTFLTANASHLLSPYVGDSEKRVAALFHAARLAQPTILFIDEIDGIFRARDGKANRVHVSILNELLQAMDGANVRATTVQGVSVLSSNIACNKDQVLVCAATNRPYSLDPALLRPGRFDRLVYIPPPDLEARLDILKIKTSKICLESPDILENIAAKTDGFTGAELENLVSKAVVTSIKESLGEEIKLPVRLEDKHLLGAFENSSPAVTESEITAFEKFQEVKC